MRPALIAASLALAAAIPGHAQTPAAPPAPAVEAAPVADPASSAAATPAATPAPAPAAAAAPAAVIGDAKRGEALTYTCRGCHGVVGYKNAYPNYHVPRIGGQQQQYLLRALMEYREGSRKHPTMQAQSESFTEQQIADIAAYLSGFKP